MTLVNNSEIDLQKLLENTTMSTPDSFTKARRPQYKLSNESAAQRGQSSKPTAESAINDSDWDVISASQSTAEDSGCTASHSRHSRNRSHSLPELTAVNIQLHNMMTDLNAIAINERIWRRADQSKHSVVAKGTLTRCSELTIDLGEPYCPLTANMDDSDMKEMGAWIFDTQKPPMV